MRSPKNLNELLADLAAWITVAAVALISWVSIDDPVRRIAALGLCLSFVAVQAVTTFWFSRKYEDLYLAIQTAITTALFPLGINSFAAPILFFVLSSYAMTLKPVRRGVVWIAIFALITFVGFGLITSWSWALVSVGPFIGGYLFFGAFGKNTQDAEEARAASQKLADELAAANQQLREYTAQAEELAVADERNRLARELHDSLGHRLTVAVVQLEGAQRLIPNDPGRAAAMIGTMREQMKEALGDLRRSLASLRAPVEADLPLDQALQRLSHEFQASTGLKVHLEINGLCPDLPAAERLALYRAAQEALTNTHKHARARTIWLRLDLADETLRLVAADDGQGFSDRDPSAFSFGLRGLHERATQLGGELTLSQRLGGGAQLEFKIPCPASS
jgi:signal transduction histidine kinase